MERHDDSAWRRSRELKFDLAGQHLSMSRHLFDSSGRRTGQLIAMADGL